MNNKRRKIGVLLSYTYFVVNTIIGIFLSSFIVRSIGKTDYGVYQSMTAFVAYLVLLEFGTGTIISRNLSILKKDGSDSDEVRKNISTIWTLTSVLGFAICLVAFLFFVLIPIIYSNSMTSDQITLGKGLFVFSVATLLCSFVQQTFNGILIGNEFYIFEKAVSLIKLLSRSALVLVFLSFSPNIYYLVIIDAILNAGMVLATYVFIKIKLRYRFTFRYFDKQIFRIITPLCLAMLLQTIINIANGTIDKFLISIMMTPEDVTIYSVAMAMFSMFSSIATLPVTMYMPQVAKNIKSGLTGRNLTETLIEPCRLNVLITGLIAFGFACVGNQFISILYGADFHDAWICSLIVIFPMFMNMSNAVIINVLDVLNKRHVRSLILMITTAANIVMTIVGIVLFGIIGAAIATGISLIAQVILLNYYYSRKIGLSIVYLFAKSFKGILLPLIISFAAAFVIHFMFDNLYVQFFVCGSVFVLLFVVLFLLFGVNEYEKGVLLRIKKRVFKR